MGFGSSKLSPEELRKQFVAAGQGHVFKFIDEGKVSAEDQEKFFDELRGLDLDYIAKSYASAIAEAESGGASSELSPPSDFATLAGSSEEDIAMWERTGLEAVGRGEIAACVLAGGQGTRLGFDGPKGCYNMGLPSGKPLFQLMSEKIACLIYRAKEAGGKAARVPFLVMTSPINHTETEEFFKANNYFGLSSDDVWFFTQGTLPCLTKEGKIILETSCSLATAPDGNGGIYPALNKSGCLAKLKTAGVKYLHVFSVDNALSRPADPRFAGFCISKDADCGNKCVWKVSPDEAVGVVAKRDGRYSVVEYNVVVPSMATMFHLANKKIPYAGEDGCTIKPESNNGIKLESFIFDVFPMSERMAILETERAEEFAPVKNAPGAATDSPDTARAMVSALAQRWVAESGGKVVGNKEILEISPLASYAGEGLKDKVAGNTYDLNASAVHIQ